MAACGSGIKRAGRRHMTTEERLDLLNLVRENQELLFTAFSYGKDITSDNKRACWDSINEHAFTNDYPAAAIDGKTLRDHWWTNEMKAAKVFIIIIFFILPTGKFSVSRL